MAVTVLSGTPSLYQSRRSASCPLAVVACSRMAATACRQCGELDLRTEVLQTTKKARDMQLLLFPKSKAYISFLVLFLLPDCHSCFKGRGGWPSRPSCKGCMCSHLVNYRL